MNSEIEKPESPAYLQAQIAEMCQNEKHLFRGEQRTHDHVSSTIFRKFRKSFHNDESFLPLHVEMEIVEIARRAQYSDATTTAEILTDLRHFGGDTTLIDFTYSLPIALFFACNGNLDQDGRIIAVPVNQIPKRFIEEPYGAQNSLSLLSPVRTSISRARTEFQSSIFIHAPRGYVDQDDSKYLSINISKELKRSCLEFLDKFNNVRFDTIYNDLAGYIENMRNWDEAASWFVSGLEKARNKQYEEAIECYNRSIQINPGVANVWYHRGNANAFLNRIEDAQNDYKKAKEL